MFNACFHYTTCNVLSTSGLEFEARNLVLMRNSHQDGRKNGKLEYLGPYTITECLGKGVYKLSSTKTGEHCVFSYIVVCRFLPARASEQGNIIGLVSVYIVVIKKIIVIERTRDLIYLKFVVTDFFLKIISPSAGENSGDLA